MKSPILLLLLAAACSSGSPMAGGLPLNEFHYVGRSPAGMAVLDGRLHLDYRDDSTVSGSWEIRWLPGADTTLQAGPQVGSGQLSGRWHGTTLVLDLNPNYADNNVILSALPVGNGWSGTWAWATIGGIETEGHFTATAP
ncbi:MAG: hypothetical protein ABJC74_11585 [Gemmatimonadota bacterium]